MDQQLDPQQAATQGAYEPEDVSFSQLILGFASAALHYTGDSPLAAKAGSEKNLALAKHNIDIVRLLHAKTQGNLAADEASLIEEVLADLAHKYSVASRQGTDEA